MVSPVTPPSSTTSAAKDAKPQQPPASPLNDLQEHAAKFMAKAGTAVGRLDQQRTWGLAHLAFLLLAAVYIVNLVVFNVKLFGASYRLSMLALVVAYGIAIRRHVGAHFAADMATAERVFTYDGAPYFALSLMWWVMGGAPQAITLLPLAVYSAFHVVACAKDDAEVKRSGEWRQWGEPLCMRLMAHQSTLLYAAAHLEIFALPFMLLSWLFGRGTSFLQVVFYFQLLRWQYTVSPKIRSAVKQWNGAWEQLIQHPSCPKKVRAADRWVRKQLAMAIQQQQSAQPTGQQHRQFPASRSSSNGSVHQKKNN